MNDMDYDGAYAPARRWREADLTPGLMRAAYVYARDYDGSFEFLVGLRQNIRSYALHSLTRRQARAVLNCMSYVGAPILAAPPPPLSLVHDRYVTTPAKGPLFFKTNPASRCYHTIGDLQSQWRIRPDGSMMFASLVAQPLCQETRWRPAAVFRTIEDADAVLRPCRSCAKADR